MQLFAAIERAGHEQVIFCRDPETGELGAGGYQRARALALTEKIEPTLRSIFAESKRSGAAPGGIALRLARERIERRRTAIA